jgi:hypothetical protein
MREIARLHKFIVEVDLGGKCTNRGIKQRNKEGRGIKQRIKQMKRKDDNSTF